MLRLNILVHPMCLGVRACLRYILFSSGFAKLMNNFSFFGHYTIVPQSSWANLHHLGLCVKVLVALYPLQHLTSFMLFCWSGGLKIVTHYHFVCTYLITLRLNIFLYIYLTLKVFLFILKWGSLFCLFF